MGTKYYLAIGLILVSMTAIAQPAPPATPIDGGLSILLGVAGALGIRKIIGKEK